MLRALVRITTGLELAFAALTAFIGVGFAALVSVGTGGSVRLPVVACIAVATVALLAWNGLTILRRYQRLRSGQCGHASCHGTLETSEDIPDHLLICDQCRRVWPRLIDLAPQPVAG